MSERRPVSNFHTHNYMCGHARGTVCDYVEQAVACGYEVIGISDHCVPPIGSGEPYITLATLETGYLPQFEEAERKYGDAIEIKKGVEIEFFDGHNDYYESLLDKLDYLVMGQHEFMLDGARRSSFWEGTDDKTVCAYFDNVTRGVLSGYFALVAHPDLIFYRSPPITPAVKAAFATLVRECACNDVALELNANGVRNHGSRYPTPLLTELCKKYDAPVAVSSDCHLPSELCDKYVIGLYDHAVNARLNVVDRLPKMRE